MTDHVIPPGREEGVLALVSEICDLHDEGKTVKVSVCEKKRTRSLSQNALQHVIYQDISKYLIKKGRLDCSPEWIKRMLKNKFLGWVDSEYVDIVTGDKEIRQELMPTSQLDPGESYRYTTQILDWCVDIGCEIKIPANCEYRKLQDEMND